MSYNAVPKEKYPDLNKRERRALARKRGYGRFAKKVKKEPKTLIVDGYELFSDPCMFDMICVRPAESRSFNNTVHVDTMDQARSVVDWLLGRGGSLPDSLEERDAALLNEWYGGNRLAAEHLVPGTLNP